jgi:hypothetical protein
MTDTDRDVLPEPGRLDPEQHSPKEWKRGMERRREALIGETADILTECDDADEAARSLNRLYAPFNQHDARGLEDNHLVVSAEGDGELRFEFRDLDHESAIDYRDLELQSNGIWWFEDKEPLEDVSDDRRAHVKVAYNCIALVPWGDEEMLARRAGLMKSQEDEE